MLLCLLDNTANDDLPIVFLLIVLQMEVSLLRLYSRGIEVKDDFYYGSKTLNVFYFSIFFFLIFQNKRSRTSSNEFLILNGDDTW